LVRIDVEVPVSDDVVRVAISDGGVMGRTYGYSDGSANADGERDIRLRDETMVDSVNWSLSCFNGIDNGIII
jgi:hypothetical protein